MPGHALQSQGSLLEEMRNQGFGVIHPAIESGKLAPAVEAEVQKKMETFIGAVSSSCVSSCGVAHLLPR
jgi:hypothetical protein